MAKCELIELQDLTPDDRIELAPPTGLPPISGHTLERWGTEKAVRMVGERVHLEDPDWLTGTPGRGHDFQPSSQTQLSWCDLCGEFIWGLYKQSLCCTHCQYTCHYRCQPFIRLDCTLTSDLICDQSNYCEDTIETDTNVDEQVDWRKQELSSSEIQQKVKEYNAQVNSNLFMVLNRDSSYTGFIKVQFKLARPVSVPPPRSVSSSSQDGGCREDKALKHRTSFYLPRDTVKHLHISSKTRARDVIEALLKKFTVVDNPAKYSLFERSERQNQVYLRKLSDDAKPLFLRLCAGPNEKALSLVLKENETGEVNWDAFSFPELQNFLRILQREEEDYVRQIVKRYALAREKMKDAMKNLGTPG
ncbi:ras association domain-containing protein 1 isoform X1 [Triplophysa dalaica]|uniref:ras association domain-containing protein 1 isoform X1 n=1 Tax=Triplophysa dalaica TaxID=1582913 RepID=UPI0024DF39AB|nr:ras association domain-containing protein 1 isoform X1 [Triplophysa dalaica]XP_056614133.1 ras association domain-containing protein 1 isoform X1 [Triplophysa dalaica]XP_056614134.1 ras association domain-containing protein 1 isoform X1 [Triplophysa dalaica]XP_056614135.1 ras association domain-containing protein 1 isoform X1 [Triplophysa dalaica]